MTESMRAEVVVTDRDGRQETMTLAEWLGREDSGEEVSIDLDVRGGGRTRLTRAMLRRAMTAAVQS